MDTEISIAEGSIEKNISYILEKIISEEPTNGEQLIKRWEKGFNEVFLSITRSVSGFFASRIKTTEIEEIQSFIKHLFRKANYIEKVKNNYEQQNAFLLGYCHAIKELIDSFETEISYQKNDVLKSVISSYKYVEPILRILDSEFEISHRQLAEKVGISESALSNYMNKMKKYYLVNYTRIGKNKFYSLAYPNGEEALKIIKNNMISADGYTDLLLEIMNSLINISTCDESGKEDGLKKCEKMIRQYTTKPALCKKKLDELSFISKSERIYYNSLIVLELAVKETVTVFTRDFRSEEKFYATIRENLEKNIVYQWFFTETQEFKSAEQIKDAIFKKLETVPDLDDTKNEKLWNNIQCYIIPQDETDGLLGDIYDAVIYDENEGFSCVDVTIADETPYIRMTQEKVAKLNDYVRKKNSI